MPHCSRAAAGGTQVSSAICRVLFVLGFVVVVLFLFVHLGRHVVCICGVLCE